MPLKIWRACVENSFWVDEIYSVMMAHRSFGELIFFDPQHDNLYFILLKLWIGIGRNFPFISPLLWARFLNVLGWIILSLIVWFGSRRLLGNFKGSVLSWVILSGAMVAYMTKEMRSYALPSFTLFTCLLIQIWFWNLSLNIQKNDITIRKSGFLLWIIYAICGMLALYSNILSALFFALLTINWLIIGLKKSKFKSIFITGLAVHIVMALLYLPWLLNIRQHIGILQMQDRSWMTPPTLWNLISVFILWFPFGLIPLPSGYRAALIYFLGSLSLLLPWGAFLYSLIFYRDNIKSDHFLLKLTIICAYFSVTFILILFFLNLAAGIMVFHAPRYPSIVVPVWAMSLALAALFAMRRMKRTGYFVLLLLAPWFCCSVGGQHLIQSCELHGGFHQWKNDHGLFFPLPGRDLYVFPKELIPYFSKNLKEFNIKSIDQLDRVPEKEKNVYILDLNNWKEVRSAHDEIFVTLIRSGILCDKVEIKEYSPKFSQFRSYLLRGFFHQKAKDIINQGMMINPSKIPESSLAIAIPQLQKNFEGWSILDMDEENRFFRWGMTDTSKIRFNRPLKPGNYILHLIGYRRPYPTRRVLMKFRFHGEKDEIPILQNDGPIHIRIPVRLTRKHRVPRLLVSQPSWRPSDYIEGNRDHRNLTFMFKNAWIE